MLPSPEPTTPRAMIVALTLLSAAAMAGQIYLIAKGEATELFGQLRGAGAASGRKPARTEGIDGAFD